MLSLLLAFKDLKRISQKLREELRELSHLQELIPQERVRLLEEKYLKEVKGKGVIKDIQTRVMAGLTSIHAYTLLARRIAQKDAPQRYQREWRKQREVLDNLMQELDQAPGENLPLRLLTRAWTDSVWMPSGKKDSYCPQTEGLAPGVLRLGDLVIERELNRATVPALVPIRRISDEPSDRVPGHVVIYSNDSGSRQTAISAIESIALRVLSTFPVRKLQGLFIDPVALGDSFPFKSLPRFMVGQQTYTRSEDIRQQLRKLTEHTEQVIQNYLSRYYSSIEHYNSEKSAIEEPYRYLFVADFPTNFDNSACEDLKSLLLNGPRAGVYVVLHVDDTLEKPNNFSYDLLDEFCTVLRPSHGLKSGGGYNRQGGMKAGYVYMGRITRMLHTGAYAEFLPGKEGFIQNSQLTGRRISHPQDVVSIGEILPIKILNIDGREQVNLTCIGIQPHEEAAAKRKAFDFSASVVNGKSLFRMRLPNGLDFNIRLDSPPPNEQFNAITAALTEAAKSVKVDAVAFTELYPSEFWAADSRREIRAPIGVTGARDRIEFWMGNNEDGLVVSSGLLAGKPGAGKSYTLHSIITSLAMKYSPDELEMYLLDFKEGVEFQIYVDPDKATDKTLSEELDDSWALPHARVISIESDREFGLSVLQRVQQEIEQRGSEFKKAGVSSLVEYRDKTGITIPRLLVVIDEFQYLFQDSDAITRQLNLIFEDITRRGRAFGVHLLIASQSPNVLNMSRGIYSFIELRMAMQMDENTAGFVLADGNTRSVDLLERPGKLIYNKDFGRKSHNDIGQVADASLIARQAALQAIRSVADAREYQRPEPLILFNGNRPTRLSHNPQLSRLSEMPGWLSSAALNKQVVQASDWLPQEFPGVAWLGEAMRIGNHTQAIFRRRARSNMLVVGSSEETVYGILSGILLSLVHCYEPQKAELRLMDLSYADDEGEVHWAGMMTQFRDCFEDYFAIRMGKRFVAGGDRTIQSAQALLHEVYQEFEQRQQHRDENPNELNLESPIFFVCAIGSLNRAQNLRPVVGRRGDEISEDAQRLLALASKGAELGIHVILWVDSTKAFMQMFGDSRSVFTHFDLRVGLTMPADDSRMLFGEPFAQNLPRFRGYFSDVAVTSGVEKFKPYAIGTDEEMKLYQQRFEHRRSEVSTR